MTSRQHAHKLKQLAAGHARLDVLLDPPSAAALARLTATHGSQAKAVRWALVEAVRDAE